MTKAIVNLALPVVAEEIDKVLQSYPENSYRAAFSRPDLHQKLTAYVLNRIPGVYAVQEEAIAVCQNSSCLAEVVGRRSEITLLIHRGIRWLYQEHLEGSALESQQAELQPMPSHWFG